MNTPNAARTQRMLRQVQDFDSWAILIFVVGVFAIPVLEYARPLQTQNWAGKCQDAPDGSANQEPVAGERRVKTPMQARAAAEARRNSPPLASRCSSQLHFGHAGSGVNLNPDEHFLPGAMVPEGGG